MTTADTKCPGNSRTVQSNQVDTHPHLLTILRRRKGRAFEAPIKEHTEKAFYDLLPCLAGHQKLILDAACGTGYSTVQLATQFPDHLVIGIDHSLHRLQRGERQRTDDLLSIPKNLYLLRADCVDFWRLAKREALHFEQQFLLYPNPYPKKKHLLRRWHAHPIFPVVLSLSGALTLRTNWELYAKEFAMGIEYYTGMRPEITTPHCTLESARSLFEMKYLSSGHQLYEISTTLPSTAPQNE